MKNHTETKLQFLKCMKAHPRKILNNGSGTKGEMFLCYVHWLSVCVCVFASMGVSWCDVRVCVGSVTVSHYHCHCFMLLLQSALTCNCPSSQQSEQSPKDMSHPCAPIKDSTRDNTAAFLTQRSKNEVRPPDSSLSPASSANTESSSSDCFSCFVPT